MGGKKPFLAKGLTSGILTESVYAHSIPTKLKSLVNSEMSLCYVLLITGIQVCITRFDGQTFSNQYHWKKKNIDEIT